MRRVLRQYLRILVHGLAPGILGLPASRNDLASDASCAGAKLPHVCALLTMRSFMPEEIKMPPPGKERRGRGYIYFIHSSIAALTSAIAFSSSSEVTFPSSVMSTSVCTAAMSFP